MTALRDWLPRLLAAGESVLESPPIHPPADRDAVRSLLREAFQRHSLDIAGDSPPFDPAVAERSALLVAVACWRAVCPEDTTPIRCEPPTADSPLSADVTLRFLPTVYRRARSQGHDNPLTTEVAAVLRSWPLSGVLADLADSPTTAPTFAHTGLRLLYAERLATRPRAAWLPPDEAGRRIVDRVFHERGIPVPTELSSV
jgi:hypothetical protein